MKKNLILVAVGGLLLISSCNKQESESDFRNEPHLKGASAAKLAVDTQVNSGIMNGHKVLNFRAHLGGGQEVPPRETLATGQAVFQLSKDGEELSYKLLVANLENIVQAHIHVAVEGANGPVVIWLYPSAPPALLIPGITNGPLFEGVITSADFRGILAGSRMTDLIDLMAANNTYVNVHTTLYPGGEIRGQVFGLVPGE